eukprot:gene14532-10386_t
MSNNNLTVKERMETYNMLFYLAQSLRIGSARDSFLKYFAQHLFGEVVPATEEGIDELLVWIRTQLDVDRDPPPLSQLSEYEAKRLLVFTAKFVDTVLKLTLTIVVDGLDEIDVNVEKAVAFLDGTSDVCVITKKLRKTILWTMGQGLLYQTRLPPNLHKEWSDENTLIMKLLRSSRPKHHKRNTCITASIHVRTGHPDFGRRSLNGSEHITNLNAMNEELMKNNKEICGVFVATSDPNATIFASATLGKLSPMHGYDVLLMPRFVGNTSMEMEHQIWYLTASPEFRPDRLYVEYLVDLKSFGETEVHIGSHSNMFLMAAGYRAALHPEYPNEHSCFLNSIHPDIPLACFGSEGALQFFQNGVHGFDGGSIYFY